jgi:large subunit ribosomal protein L13
VIKTYRPKASEIRREWQVLDASGQTLGRLATQAAIYLRGKHKPTFSPHMDMGDHVVIVNAEQILVTGQKLKQKVYYRHSGYPGGLKSRTLEQELAKFPNRVIERAVRGMLPRGALGEAMYRKLHVYAGPNHPHRGQVMPGLQRGSTGMVAAPEGAAPEPSPDEARSTPVETEKEQKA